jgi:hypothetical protein
MKLIEIGYGTRHHWHGSRLLAAFHQLHAAGFKPTQAIQRLPNMFLLPER